ncbi:(4Fe-4S)-binding protein [Mucilaginibacter sp. UR6-1]|uniref:(4Fe-4S)-binding protein n=1 Tax=Mucilaginibacter sp. UR6-1 TaxID=1435643 RepID=UPI001E4DF6D0|nr:(4Fe-4S)-binding protein [Mucilaginibacter sp. UR6-1]MCC8407500.1 (4Fe-4S)-binding protein [Mucilaginibacter sp. UR6-1]
METLEYFNGEVTILWKPKVCIHSGICVKTLPQVYNPKARPWIRPENATTQEIINQVAMCPSGALSIKEHYGENLQVWC